MMKPIETTGAPVAVASPAQPVKRDTDGLRATPVGVEQAATLSKDTSSAAKEFTAKQLEDAINERLDRLIGANLRMRVEQDQDSGKYVYQSVDKVTGEVVDQYPSEQVLRTSAFFKELDGLLYDKRA